MEAKDSDKGIAYGSPWVSALTPHVPFRLTRDGVDRAVGVGENSRESSELAEGGSTFSWCQYILFTHQSIVGVLPRGLTHLTFECNFNQEIHPNVLPQGLTPEQVEEVCRAVHPSLHGH